jgi:diguanylate cyclase (GGDEF)-like protein
MKATIDNVALSALVFAVLAIAAVSTVAVVASGNLIAANDLTQSRQQLLSSLESIRFHALAINVGQQNYALTGEDRDFAAYRSSVIQIEAELANFTNLPVDLGALTGNPEALKNAVRAVIARQNAMVEVSRAQGLNAARALARAHVDEAENERLLVLTQEQLSNVRKNLAALAAKDTEFGARIRNLIFALIAITAIVLVSLYGILRRLNQKQRNAQVIMQHQATHDTLTGLYNRAAATEHINERLEEPSTRALGGFALLLLDLDGFKAVNDTLGHAAGDTLLKQAAARMALALRESDFLARLGGDEFLVVLPQISDAETLARVTEKLIASIDEPFALGDASGKVTLSIGISVFPRDATEREALMKCADLALYEAKRAGRNRAKTFVESMRGFATKAHTKTPR